MKRMNVIVAGSRTVTDYAHVKSCLDNILLDEKAKVVIISGTAKGADKLGAKWAIETDGIELAEMPAQWDRYGKSAGYRRNEDMARLATHVIVFWDGSSVGSQHMINSAKKRELPLRILAAAPAPEATETADLFTQDA